MASYRFDPKLKLYAVPAADRVGHQYRKTRISAGSLATSNRSGHARRLSREALALTTRGSTDTLSNAWLFRQRSERVCGCCGQAIRAFVLSPAGRRKLKEMRRARAS